LELDISIIYLLKANSLFGLAKYSRSLEYYNRIESISLYGQKYTGLGMCCQKLGLYEESEKNYVNAIKANPSIPETYFNFAVLRFEQKNNEGAKKLLEECLKIDKNFRDATQLLKKLDDKHISDWYKWWFTENWKKKVLGGILVTFIILSVIFANLIILSNLVLKDAYVSQDEIWGFALTIGFLLLILLFPSIKKMKFKDFEVEISLFEFKDFTPNLIAPKPTEAVEKQTYGVFTSGHEPPNPK